MINLIPITNSRLFILAIDATDDIEMKEEENESVKEGTTAEVPMLHLASFALHKLFTEWQSEGFEIPDFKNGGAAGLLTDIADASESVQIAPQALPVKTTVPDNANSMHPTTLLCMVGLE